MTLVVHTTVGRPTEEEDRRIAEAVLAVLVSWRPRRSEVARYLEEGGDPRGAVVFGEPQERQMQAALTASLGATWASAAHGAAEQVGRADPHERETNLWARRRAEDIVAASALALAGIGGWLQRRDDEWTQAGVLVRSVGQTLPGATATEAYRRGLLSGGVITPKMASERADRNADHRLRIRSGIIGRTETQSARLSGTQVGAATLAHPEGVAVFRAWAGACEECAAADGFTVPLGDPAAGEGWHVGCLCDWAFYPDGKP